jgi:hypothetical protein
VSARRPALAADAPSSAPGVQRARLLGETDG